MKKILFVCVENSCRSQMAEGWARNWLSQQNQKEIEAYSAGSRPSGKVNPQAIEVMQEKGIDISGNVSKGFDQLPAKDFDYAVTLGCQDKCPFVSAERHIDWNVEDPKGREIDFFRQTRDTIARFVETLLRDIDQEE